MKIALVIPTLGPGGAERVMSVLANAWAGTGHRVTLITTASTASDFYPLDSRIKRIGLDLPAPSRNKISGLRFVGRAVSGLRAHLRLEKPDVVISFLDSMNVLTLIAAMRLGTPVIVAERSDPRMNALGLVWRTARRITYPGAKAVVVQTKSVYGWAHRFLSAGLIHQIHNPVRVQGRSRNGEQAYTSARSIVTVARLGPEKGIDILLRAFALCAVKHPDWSLVIVGEGPDRKLLEDLTERLEIRNRVQFKGLIQNPEEMLAHSDLFVLASRREGFPNTLLEALAAGLPAISTSCNSGPAEIIRHEIDGLLVPPENVDALAAAMDRLMSSEAERQGMAARAIEVYERFNSESILARWTGLARQVATAANPEGRSSS